MAKKAKFWVLVYAGLVLAPVAVLAISREHLGNGFWWDLAMILGFAGFGMLGIQFALTARFHRLNAPFGTDLLYYFHRYLALVAFAIVVFHIVIIWIGNPVAVGSLNPLKAAWHMTAGFTACALYLALILISLLRKRLGFEYDHWRRSHALLAVGAYLLAMGHIEGVGYLVETPALRVFWTSCAFFWVGVVIFVRLVRPWRLSRTPYAIRCVRKERGTAWTLTLEAKGHRGFDFHPGQFAWVTIGHSPFAMKDHPFSISSAPNGNDRFSFTIKALGNFTSTIGSLEQGERAFVDGPYGIFTIDRYPRASGFVLIAGGVGIAPFMSMLEAMATRSDSRPVILFYGNRTWERTIFRERLDSLRQHPLLALTVVHVLREPPEGWQGERGFITRDVLARHMPENPAGWEALLCGPTPMLKLVEAGLVSLGQPQGRIHSEIFDLA